MNQAEPSGSKFAILRSRRGHNLTRRTAMARGTGRKNRTSGIFGSVDKLATGYRARYYGPDGRRHKAPTLFITKGEARSWLALRHAEIIRKAWQPPEAQVRKTPR